MAQQFKTGDRIVVRSTNPDRDGFVSNVGRFLRYKCDGAAFEYSWNGLTAFQFFGGVKVAPFAGRATDDAAGLVA